MKDSKIKDSTRMNGPVVAHLGQDIIVGPKAPGIQLGEVCYPGISFFSCSWNAGKDEFTLQVFEGVWQGPQQIKLSEGNGIEQPIGFEYNGIMFTILGRRTDEPDNLIINLSIPEGDI